jgi:iron complex outermembrane receptor protein
VVSRTRAQTTAEHRAGENGRRHGEEIEMKGPTRFTINTAVGALMVACAAPGMTQDAPAQSKPDSQETPTEADIVITGSLIRGEQEDGALPIEVITSQELLRQGSPSAVELLKALPVANGTLGDSNQFDSRSQGAEGIASINLRGLGPSRTLVLLNSRRLVKAGNGVPTVDINLLPLAAIGRIDILKDGAAATYGSDAIAGVANFITNRQLQGLVVSGDYKFVDGSDGDWTVSAALGHRQDGFRILASAGYQYRSELMAIERDFALGSYLNNPENGFSSGGNPSVFLPVFGNGAPAGAVRPDVGCVPLGGVLLSANGVPNQRCANQYLGFDALTDTEKRLQTYVEVGVDLTPDVELEVSALYGRSDVPNVRTSPSYLLLQRPSPNTLPSSFGATAIAGWFVPASNPGYQSYVAANPGALPGTVSGLPVAGATFPYLLFRPFLLGGSNGFDPSGSRASDSIRLSAALTGKLTDTLNFDASFTYHSYTRHQENFDLIGDRVQLALRGFGGPNCNRTTGAPGTGGCVFLNPFSNAIASNPVTGVANPGFDASVANPLELTRWLYGQSRSQTETELFVGEATISGHTGLVLPGGDVNFAIGGQYRRELFATQLAYLNNLDLTPCRDTPINGNLSCDPQTGPLGFLGSNREADLSGDVYAAFTELRAPILDALDLQLAARYEDYGGTIGATFNPKGTLRWQATNWFALRASIGTTFRGPPLTTTTDGRVTSLQVIGSASRPVEVTGNPQLTPESATNYSAGAIVNTGGLALSVDYFRYDVENLIIAEPVAGIANALFGTSGSANCGNPDFAALQARFTFNGACNINNVARLRTFYKNGAGVTNSGLDFSASYRTDDLLGGRFGLGATATYVLEYRVDDEEVEGIIVQPSFDAVGQLNYQTTAYPLPRWRGQGFLEFGGGPIDARLTVNYVDGYFDQRTAPFAPRPELPGNPAIAHGQTIDSSITADLTVRVQLPSDVTASFTVINVTDEDPSFARLDYNYDPFTGSALGRQFKLGLSKQF